MDGFLLLSAVHPALLFELPFIDVRLCCMRWTLLPLCAWVVVVIRYTPLPALPKSTLHATRSMSLPQIFIHGTFWTWMCVLSMPV
jgi:hypothetical protein